MLPQNKTFCEKSSSLCLQHTLQNFVRLKKIKVVPSFSYVILHHCNYDVSKETKKSKSFEFERTSDNKKKDFF
eukprot:UN07425